jgi:uncharacterized SAM-binding protein YcdF (DUF218 family)
VFYVLSKVLWFLLQPSSLMAGAIVAGAALILTTWARLGRNLLLTGASALLVCGLLPVSDLLIAPLENRFPRAELERDTRPPAGVIILGGAEDARATPPRELAGLNEAAERYTEAVALARRYPQARIVFSGGSGALLSTELPEAVSAGRLLVALGVPRERITLEDRSRSTHENAAFTARMLGAPLDGRWLLITSAWHMPRAVGCFRGVGLNVEAWPVDYRTSGRIEARFNSAIPEGLRRLDFAMKEYIGLLAYYVTGRTAALFPAP